MSVPSAVFPSVRRVAALVALTLLGACASTKPPAYQQELFDTGSSPYSRNFNASTADTCEGARRALLSQGYMTTMTRTDTVDGTKNFQPSGDTHVVVEFHVVCTPGVEQTNTSIVYVNAVQNGYALKKSDTSASVGLSILGSLSLPIRSNNDAMVKVSSETIPSGTFYDRFFSLVDHYVQTVVHAAPVSTEKVDSKPLPGGDVANGQRAVAEPAPAAPATPASSPGAATTALPVVPHAAAVGVTVPTLAAPAPSANVAAEPDAIERAVAGAAVAQPASAGAAVAPQ